MSIGNGKTTAIIVLGMHRSGTSALTGVLGILGANPGPSLLPAIKEVNPKGFWEHAEIVATHERLLTAMEMSWDDDRPLPENWWQRSEIARYSEELLAILQRDFTNCPLWVLKDPRLCRLLPMWRKILQELEVRAHFILCLRHPAEVAMSLRRRDGLDAVRGNLLWLRHLLDSERETRGLSRVMVSYPELLKDWRALMHRIADATGILFHKDEVAAAKVNEFLEPALRHHHAELNACDTDHRVCQLAEQAHALALCHHTSEIGEALSPIAAEIDIIGKLIAPWAALNHDHARLKVATQQLTAANAALENELARVKSTFSWRITAPLRVAWNLLRKVNPE